MLLSSLLEIGRYPRRRKPRLAAPPPPPSWFGGFMPGPIAPPVAPGPPVPGYSLWLDATFVSNTTSIWHDQSGNGRNATPQSSNPTLGAGIGGMQSYNFTGTTGMITAPYNVDIASGFSVAVVYQAITLQAGQNTEIAAASGIYDVARGEGLFTLYDAILGEGNVAIGTTYSGAHVAIITWSNSAGMSSIEDDTLLVNAANTASVPGSAEVRYVGSGYNGNILKGYVGEMIEWPFLLSSPQLTSMHTYFSTKWGTP